MIYSYLVLIYLTFLPWKEVFKLAKAKEQLNNPEVLALAQFLGLAESSESKLYIDAAMTALRKASTVGECMRIQRMLRTKMRIVRSLEFMQDRA